MSQITYAQVEAAFKLLWDGGNLTRADVRAALEAAERAAWRPIEEARRDDPDEPCILIGRFGKECVDSQRVAYFNREAKNPKWPWRVEDAEEGFSHHQDWPTHFRPLPLPPEEAGR